MTTGPLPSPIDSALSELADAAWDFKMEVTGAMVREGNTLNNLYRGLITGDRLQKAHDRLVAAINAARAFR